MTFANSQNRRPKSLIAIVCALAAAGCGSSDFEWAPLDYKLLAKDMHVRIGGQPITLPLIAVHDFVDEGRYRSMDWRTRDESAIETRDQFVGATLNARTAPALDLIEVNIGNYGLSDDLEEAKAKERDLCPNLTRQWSRVLCTDAFTALQGALPTNRRFELVDLHRMAMLNGAPGAHCAARPAPLPEAEWKASIYCATDMQDADEHFTAIIRIRGDLGAIWSVWQGPTYAETAKQMADREGRAIVLFVTNGLGTRENYPVISDGMPLLRRPSEKPLE